MRSLLLALAVVVGAGLGAASPAMAQSWTQAPPPPVEGSALPEVPADWMTVPATYLRVHGPEEHAGALLAVARDGSEALPELAEQLRVPIGDTIHIYVAGSDEVFRAIQPGAPPTWADATAWPKLGAVFLRSPRARAAADAPLEQVLRHELVHVLLGRAFSPGQPPVWLQEGVAQLLAGEVGPDEAETLRNTAFTGGPIPLPSLEHAFPDDPHRARLAYAEAADFVGWLVQTYGPDTLPKLIKASADGATMRQAVYAATGTLLEDVERTWAARWAPSASNRLASAVTFATGDGLWALGGAMLGVAFVRRRRTFRRRLAEMDEEEAALDALLASMLRRGERSAG